MHVISKRRPQQIFPALSQSCQQEETILDISHHIGPQVLGG
jgi:hypothetical protein